VAHVLEAASSGDEFPDDADITSACSLDNKWRLTILFMDCPVRFDGINLDWRAVEVHTLVD
jgi:hypothetical protein